MKLSEFFSPQTMIPELQGQTKPQVVAELAHHLGGLHAGIDANELTRVLMAREELASTAVGDQIAIPHSKCEGIGQLLGCVGRSTAGVQFDSIDGGPTHLFFALVAPASAPGIHLKALARISHLFRVPGFRACLMKAPTTAAMFRLLEEADET